jgi:hypothetical protein
VALEVTAGSLYMRGHACRRDGRPEPACVMSLARSLPTPRCHCSTGDLWLPPPLI